MYFLVKGYWGCAAGWGRIFTTEFNIMGSGVARILKFCRPIAERASKVRAACARAPLAGPGACSPGEIFENCVFEIARNTLKLYNLAPCQC